MKKCFLLLSFVFLISVSAQAQTVILKSGEKISGRITLENEIFIRIEPSDRSKGTIREFLMENIESIERDNIVETAPVLSETENVSIWKSKESPIPIIPADEENLEVFAGQPEEVSIPAPEDKIEKSSASLVITDQDIAEWKSQYGSEVDPLLPTEGEPTFTQTEDPRFAFEQMTGMKAKHAILIAFLIMGAVFGVALLIFVIIGLIVSRFVDQGIERSKESGGLIRRGIALTVDSFMSTFLVILIVFLPGIFFPLDGGLLLTMIPLMFIMIFVACFYIYFGYVTFSNSYGRYVMNIKVLDEQTLTKPSYFQAFKRALTMCLWPIEALLVGFTNTKKRIGDRWAGTTVRKIRSEEPFLRRALLGILVCVFCYYFVNHISPLINDRMLISGVAKKYLAEKVRAPIDKPSRVEIFNDEGIVTFVAENNKNYLVELTHSGSVWKVKQAYTIPDYRVGKGFSIQYNQQF